MKGPPKRTPRSRLARTNGGLPSGYATFLKEVNARIRTAQVNAALAVNTELVLLYWSLGRDILARQKKEGDRSRSSDLSRCATGGRH